MFGSTADGSPRRCTLRPEVCLPRGTTTDTAAQPGKASGEFRWASQEAETEDEIFVPDCFIASSTLNTALVPVRGLLLTSVPVLTARTGCIAAATNYT